VLSRLFVFQGDHVFRKQVKRLAVLGRQFPVLPGAVS